MTTNVHARSLAGQRCKNQRAMRTPGKPGLTVGLAFLLLAFGVLFPCQANALTLHVAGSDGQPVSGFRWLVQEDTTYHINPGTIDPHTLSVRFHTSYAPVVTKGHSDVSSATIPVPADKRYFVSVLPDAGYTIGGGNVAIGQTGTTVTVHAYPLPTAQIRVLVFEDNQPINNIPDLPQELGLEGFKVTVTDAGGRYGMSGGPMMMDAFGNPLGSTYDSSGTVISMGNGVLTTDANGEVLIQNLVQGKYTIQVVPPPGQDWIQTSTIEGTRGIDAWVKPNEPPFFVEFGPPGYHVFIGFVRPTTDTTVLTGGSTIRGQVTNLHMSRPPNFTFYSGQPIPGAWVGLNDMQGGLLGRGLYAAPCDPMSMFEIKNVPPGRYQLVIWDENLDVIFALLGVTVTAGQDLNLGQVPVFNWFGKMQHTVFLDRNEDGFRDPAEPFVDSNGNMMWDPGESFTDTNGNGQWDPEEPPMADQNLNLRFRDGSLYQTLPTDVEGVAPLEQVFPFFNWLVAEVDYARFKPTGVTIVVDAGGPVLPDQGWDYPSRDVLTPQPQFDPATSTPLINPNTGNNLSRTEVGPVLLEAFQLFLGQTIVAEWGKSSYERVDEDLPPYGNFPGPEDVDQNHNGLFDPSNGGISGIAYYASTRAENDPREAVADPWEPGVPRVQVNLYADSNADGVIDDRNGDGAVTLADVDNYPFGNFPGPEDKDRNGNLVFDLGDAIDSVHTDSWDDSIPTGAQGPPFYAHGVPTDCYDGLRNFNQMRPGVFDGGYAFLTATSATGQLVSLPETTYIVEAVPPPGYEIVKEEDKNVDFGDEYKPVAFQGMAMAAMAMGAGAGAGVPELPWPCVGDLHLVPDELTLFPGIPCAFARQWRPLADRKQVRVTRGENTACDFFVFTEVPVAGNLVGVIVNDVANEFDPTAPAFGEKHSPPWLPISIMDWTGRELARTYSDEWGAYNALVPATFTANVPMPSGYSPNMVTVVLNSPGPILDTRAGSPTFGQYITDPYFNRQYSQFAYTFQYMPGTTTYLDTPVLPIAAFTGPNQFPVDCDFESGTPVIWSVSGPGRGGPYVRQTNQRLRVVSAGLVEVPNPLYDPATTQPVTISRDFGFGNTPGTVTIGGIPMVDVVWTSGVIEGRLGDGTQTGQLIVTRANGKASPVGVTVTVGNIPGSLRYVFPGPAGTTPIQDAIDAAVAGDLILVAPGVYYESVIMWKPVQLQGWGAYSTIINPVKVPAERILRWRQKIEGLVLNGQIDLLPSQELAFAGIEPVTFFQEEGAGILVVARNTSQANGGFGPYPRARIDGLTITGTDTGGGIVVNAYAHYLEISNNRLHGNQGALNGGIRIGHADLVAQGPNGLQYDHAQNDHVRIHHNQIAANGGLGGVGGGVSLYTGSDDYAVTDNVICGNFTSGNGAGIGHQGLSKNGLIARNKIYFNQSFNQGTGVSGGGVFVGGGAPLVLGGLTPGAGSVTIDGNLIQGNQAGAGDGGGIRLELVNGQDVADNPGAPGQWFKIDIINNILANNMAGLAGGGISMQDAARVNAVNNTVARNESTATAGEAFAPGSPNLSTMQPAGIVARAHSTAFRLVLGTEVPNPVLVNNIVRENRSFQFYVNAAMTPPFGLLPLPTDPQVWSDLAILGTVGPAQLQPMYCMLTDATGYDPSNTSVDPLFVRQYFNGDRGQTLIQPEIKTAIQVAAAFDEGGNFIDVRFGPLTLVNPATDLPYGDYHLQQTSPARDNGSAAIVPTIAGLGRDYDRELRPNGAGVDRGADEYYVPGSNGQNTAPTARPDNFTTRRNGPVTIAAPGVLANDTDPDNDLLTANLVTNVPAGHSLTLQTNGGFTFNPRNNFTGIVRFTYRANDGKTNSAVTTVTINVLVAGNTAPVAVNDSYTVVGGTTLSVPAPGVLANDTDANGDTLAAQLTHQGVANGLLTLNPNGSFTYTPFPGFVGADSFSYRAYDGSQSNQANVAITVTPPVLPPNDPPAPTAAGIITPLNTVGITRVIANDPNVGDWFTYAVTRAPFFGTATVTPTGIVSYTPNAGYLGFDSLIVTVTDQRGASAAVTVGVMVMPLSAYMMDLGLTVQVPPDTDPEDSDGDGDPYNDHEWLLLAAGDGFVKMADGRLQYTFGFHDLTHLLPTPSADTVVTTIPLSHVMMHGMLGAQFPAPTIKVREGKKLYLNLTNVGMVMRPDLFDPHTIHWHGFPQASSIFDGVPDASISINMAGCLTYYYNVIEPGTYLYHCHVEATEHMQMGMLGNLYVMPKQDVLPDGTVLTSFTHHTGYKYAYDDGDGSTYYDVDYPLQLSSFDSDFHDASMNVQPLPFAAMFDKYAMINGRGYPDTITTAPLAAPVENGGKPSQLVHSLVTAKKGQKILLRISNVSVTRFFTLSSPAIAMKVVGVNARLLRGSLGENLYYETNSVTLGGGESVDVILDTSNVAPGTYLLHTTNLQYLVNNEEEFGGMMTEIRITP